MRRCAGAETRGACGRAEHASMRGAQTRGACKRAEHASTRGAQARRRAERASARSTQARGRAGARARGRALQPAVRSGLSLLVWAHPELRGSVPRWRRARCRSQGHRASPAPPRTHAKHLSHSRGGLKVSVAPGCVLSCSSLPKGVRVSRVRRIADARTPNKFGGSETHTEVSQTLICRCTRVGSLKNHFGRRRSRVQAKQTRSQRHHSEEPTMHRETNFGGCPSAAGAPLCSREKAMAQSTQLTQTAAELERSSPFEGECLLERPYGRTSLKSTQRGFGGSKST